MPYETGERPTAAPCESSGRAYPPLALFRYPHQAHGAATAAAGIALVKAMTAIRRAIDRASRLVLGRPLQDDIELHA